MKHTSDPKTNMKHAFDPNIAYGWGAYRCDHCGSEFYEEDSERHNEGCPSSKGSKSLTYYFGPRQAKIVLLSGRSQFCPELRKEHLDDLLTPEQRELLLTTPDTQLHRVFSESSSQS